MQVAFGEDGAPSKALVGFCKKNRVSEGDAVVEADGKGVEYVWVQRQEAGRRAAEVSLLSWPPALPHPAGRPAPASLTLCAHRC